MPAPSIGGILPVAYACSTYGASHWPTVPPSDSTMLARNSLPSVVMPVSTDSRLARSSALQRRRRACPTPTVEPQPSLYNCPHPES